MDRQAGWNEADSHDFIDLGRFFVPDREEQIATVLDMIPDPGAGLLADLCCGEGLLSRALLERFPRARVLAMDLSPAMLEHARTTLAGYGDRFGTRQFDLADLGEAGLAGVDVFWMKAGHAVFGGVRER